MKKDSGLGIVSIYCPSGGAGGGGGWWRALGGGQRIFVVTVTLT